MRVFYFFFLFIISGLSLNAQIKGYIGIKGGGQLATAYFEHTIFNRDTRIITTFIPGYHGGVVAKIFTYQSQSSFLNAGFQTGLNYVSKGWRQTFRDTDEPGYETRMDYMELPLEAIIYAGKGKTKYFFTLGIFLEYLVDVKKDPDPNLDNIEGIHSFFPYMESRDRKFGYGGRVSVGLQRDFGFGTIHLDGFGTFSLRSMLEHGDLDSRIPDLSNHWTVGFSVAYLIPFGKMKF